MPSRHVTWTNPILLLFVAVLLIGFARGLATEGTLLDYYVLSYVGILLLWPFDEGTRFLFPIQPFLLLYAIDGMNRLQDMLKSGTLRKFHVPILLVFALITSYAVLRVYLAKKVSGNDVVTIVSGTLLCAYLLYLRVGKSTETTDDANSINTRGALFHRLAPFHGARMALFLGIVALGLFQQYGAALRNLHPDPGTFRHAPTVKVSNWIAQNTKEGDIVMIDEYAILHRLTNRKTFRFPLSTDSNVLREEIIEKSVDFLVIFNEREYEYYSPSTMRRFEAVRTLSPELFVSVHDFGQGVIYRVLKGNR